eukprot:7487041-Lingulodinium_polyedra.AAC.1
MPEVLKPVEALGTSSDGFTDDAVAAVRMALAEEFCLAAPGMPRGQFWPELLAALRAAAEDPDVE